MVLTDSPAAPFEYLRCETKWSDNVVDFYLTGFTTSMKTAEITRHKQAAAGIKPPSTWALFAEIFRKEGLRGVNKGVNAVAVRQCTNWGSRYVSGPTE